jgi:hypothetical protein
MTRGERGVKNAKKKYDVIKEKPLSKVVGQIKKICKNFVHSTKHSLPTSRLEKK